MRTHYIVAGVLAVALATIAAFPANAALTISANFNGSIFTEHTSSTSAPARTCGPIPTRTESRC